MSGCEQLECSVGRLRSDKNWTPPVSVSMAVLAIYGSTRSIPGASISLWSLQIFGVSSFSTPPGTCQAKCLSIAFQYKIKEAPLNDTKEKDRMESIVNNRARPPVKKAWDLTHITTERADQAATTHDRPQVPPNASLPPDRSVSATHVPAHRSGAEAHGYRHMTRAKSVTVDDGGQTQDVELGLEENQDQGDAAAEVRKANQETSPRRIHSFSKCGRRHSGGQS